MSPGGRQPNPTMSNTRGKRVVVINGEQDGRGNLHLAALTARCATVDDGKGS